MSDKTSGSNQGQRRHFLRDSLLLAGSVPAALTGSLGQAIEPSCAKTSQPISIGVLGCGRRGSQLAKFALAANPRCELIALADLFPDRVQQLYRSLKSQFPDQVKVAETGRLIGTEAVGLMSATKVDAVLLATLPTFQAGQVQRLIAGGKHVYVECPAATNFTALKTIRDAHRQAAGQGLQLQVGLQHRFQDFYALAIGQLNTGIIGTPVQAEIRVTRTQLTASHSSADQTPQLQRLRNWRSDPCHSHIVQLESSIASLDLIQWAIGDSPQEATCLVNARDLGGNYTVINYRCANGAVVRYHEVVEPNVRHQSRHIVRGSHGWCDLDRSRIFDHKDRLIWASGLQLPNSSAAVTQFLVALEQPVSPGELTVAACCVENAVRATSTAILGQLAERNSGRLVTVSELFT